MIAWPQSRSRGRGPSTTLGRLDRFWLPVADRSVVHFFNRNLYFPHRLRERLSASARLLASFEKGSLPRSPDRTAILSSSRNPDPLRPSALDSATGGLSGEQPLLERVHEIVCTYLEDRTDCLSAREVSSSDPCRRWILIGDGSGTDGLLVLLFSSDRDRPTVALKIAPCGVNRLAHEHDSLVLLRSTLSADLAASLPRPEPLWRHRKWQILPLSIIDGRPAYVEMQAAWQPRRHVAHHLQQAVEWLVRFHFETHSDDMFLARPTDHDALMEWATLLQEAGIEKVSWFESLWLRCQRNPVPMTAGHGDFWARNLLLAMKYGRSTTARLPGVVDWEFFQSLQAPFFDLFHFVVTYGLNFPWARYRRIEPLQALRATFIDDNTLSREVHLYLDTYCQRAGIDPSHLRDLFRLYLLGLATGGAPEVFDWPVRSPLDPDTCLEFHGLVRQTRFPGLAA